MQQRYIQLISIKKIKSFVTAILLALYTFIATPITLWHHHEYAVANASGKSSGEKKRTAFSQSFHHTASVNCTICDHAYSVYTDAVIVLPEAPAPVFQTAAQGYVFSVPALPISRFLNKGPPALA